MLAAFSAACGQPPAVGEATEALDAAEHVEFPAVVGALEATTAVARDGSGQVRLSLELPPARRGVGPSLGVAYDSNRGDGIIGPGFVVTGLSSISRCPSNVARDGRAAGVELSSRDALCLDGERLVPVEPSLTRPAVGGAEYRPLHDPTRKVLSFAAPSIAGPASFEVRSGDGLIHEYGGLGATVLAPTSPATAVSWLLRRVRDRRGNTWQVTYETFTSGGDIPAEIPEMAPRRIDYTSFFGEEGSAPADNSVTFEYDDRPDPRHGYRFGFATARTQLLRSISTTSADGPVRRYRFHYEEMGSENTSRLSELRECSIADLEEACKPPTRFRWQRPGSGEVDGEDEVFLRHSVEDWFPVYTVGRGEVTGELSTSPRSMVAFDFDGDGVEDVGYFDEARFLDPSWVARLYVRLGDTDSEVALTEVVDTGFDSYPGALLTPTDYDHDGRDDLLAMGDRRLSILRSTGTSFEVVETGLPLSGNWDDVEDAETPVIGGPMTVADMNGDGQDDVLVCGFSEDCREYVGGGTSGWGWFAGFTGLWPLLCPFGICDDAPQPQARFDCAGRWYYAEGLGGSYAPWVDTGVDDRCYGTGLARPGDFDGDGRTEVLITPSAGGESAATRVMSLNDGAFSATATHMCMVSAYWSCDEGLDRVAGPAQVLDFNGDGNHDVLLHATHGGEDGQDHQVPYVAYGSGDEATAFRNLHDTSSTDPFFTAYTNLLISPMEDRPLTHVRPVTFDFTGDGRADLLQPAVERDYQEISCLESNLLGCQLWGWPSGPLMGFVSDGYGARGLYSMGTWRSPQTTHEGVARRRTQFLLVDANGDGARDVIQLIEEPLEAFPRSSEVEVHFNIGGLPRHVVAVETGVGRREELDYAPLTTDVYSPGTTCSYPVECVRDTRYVVSRRRADNGTRETTAEAFGATPAAHNETTYHYEDARNDVEARAYPGFAAVVATDTRTGRRTRTEYDNRTRSPEGWYVFADEPTKSITWVASASPEGHDGLSSTYLATVVENRHLPTAFPDGVTADSYLQRRTRVHYEGMFDRVFDPWHPELSLTASQTETTLYSQDPTFGQESRRETTRDDGSVEVVRRTRSHRPGDWLLGLVPREVRESTTPNGSAARTLERSYDATGYVDMEVREPGDPDAEVRSTVVARDPFGNPTRVMVEAAGREPATTHVGYDSTATFVKKITNPLGHTENTYYHRGLGVPVLSLDANGRAHRRYYDGFGRLTRVRQADGRQTTITYSLSSVFAGALEVETSTPGWDHRVIQLDRLGRTTQTEERGYRGQWTRRLVGYDARGLLRSRSEPYWTSTFATRFTVWSYDFAGRRLSETLPSGVSTLSWYGANRRWSRDGRGNTTEYRLGPNGRVDEVREPSPGGGTTTYGYGPHGQLVYTVNAAGHTTTIGYDGLGRRASVADPNAGLIRYELDAFGNVAREVLADGRWVEHSYDAIGRRVHRLDEEGITKFVWDTGPGAVGALASASSSADSTVLEYGYDSFGRPVSESLHLDDGLLTVERTYDARGRVSALTYSNGERLDYQLDDYGNLEQIRRGADVLFQVDTVNAAGQIEEERFLNGVETVRRYGPASGDLVELSTRGRVHLAGTTGFVDQTFVQLEHRYDSNGNIEWLRDGVRGYEENYVYDSVDRLHELSSSMGTLDRWLYDAVGNVLRSPEASLIRYGETLPDGTRVRPDAVVAVGSDVYGYDDAGRLTTGPELGVQYTSYDLPRQLDSELGTTSYRYDAHGRAAVVEGPDGAAYRLGGLCELRVSWDGAFEYRIAISAGSRRVGEIVRSWNGSAWDDRTLFFHEDRLGSMVAVSDDGGEVVTQGYEPFGRRRLEPHGMGLAEFGTELGFTSHRELPGTSVVDMSGRFYESRAGRFLTPDPLVQSPLDPRSLNRYAYVWNNPLNATDPTGFETEFERRQRAEVRATMGELRQNGGQIHSFGGDPVVSDNPATDESPMPTTAPSGTGGAEASGETVDTSGPSGSSQPRVLTPAEVYETIARNASGPYNRLDGETVAALLRRRFGNDIAITNPSRAPRFLPLPRMEDLVRPTVGPTNLRVYQRYQSPYMSLEQMNAEWRLLRSSPLGSYAFLTSRMAGQDRDTAMALAHSAALVEVGITLDLRQTPGRPHNRTPLNPRTNPEAREAGRQLWLSHRRLRGGSVW